MGWMLKRLSSVLDAEMHRELSRLDLNLNQFAVLMTLLESEGMTQTEIGQKIGMPGYATTRSLDALEEARLLERRPDERSRRSHRIHLTDVGRAMAPDLFAIVGHVNEQLLAPLAEDERLLFATILEKLVHAKLTRSLESATENALE